MKYVKHLRIHMYCVILKLCCCLMSKTFGVKMDAELKDILEAWDLDAEAISLLEECGILSVDLLKMMESKDISEVFVNRNHIHYKIKFRYKLQKWRLENRLDTISCSVSDKTLTNDSTISNWVKSANEQFELKKILEASIPGQDVLKNYTNKKFLSETDQTNIVRLVVDYFLLKDLKMSPSQMIMVSNAIVETFPTEATAIYYIPRQGKTKPSGNIHDRYFNCIHKRKNIDAPMQKKTRAESPSVNPDVLPDNEEQIKQKMWLMHNQPSNLLEIWKETCELRMRSSRDNLKHILENWPRYKDAIGTELINIDFEYIHPQKGDMLFNKIENFQLKMCAMFDEIIKDKLNLHFYDKMKNPQIQPDSKLYYFFNLIHAIVIPPRLNNKVKPSISEAQEDTFIHLANINNLRQKMDELCEEAFDEKLSIQPKIIVVGESVENLKEFYLYLNGNMFKVPTLVTAVDLLIKCSFVLIIWIQ